jgi:hypothetical protein
MTKPKPSPPTSAAPLTAAELHATMVRLMEAKRERLDAELIAVAVEMARS